MAFEVSEIVTDREIKWTVTGAAVTCGQVVVVEGKVGVVETLEGGAVGDSVIVRVKGVAKIPAATGTTFAADANVQFNTSTRLAVASGGTHAGRAFYAKISGPLFVWVELNKIAAA
jgi:predicted RecA/RadA family phage recombinase